MPDEETFLGKELKKEKQESLSKRIQNMRF